MKITAFITIVLISLALITWFATSSPQLLQLTPVIDPVSPLYLGVIPFLQEDELREQTQPVSDYLSARLGQPVKLITVPDYESLARLVDLGKVHIAWFSHASFEHLRGNREWQALCRPVQHGDVLYMGQIIVHADSPYQKLEDLQGKCFAYVERFSGSGFYFPNLLMAAQGIRPLEFFSEVVFTQSHRSSISGILDGRYDAAAVFSSTVDNQTIEGLRVIAHTGPITNDPLIVSAKMPAELKNKIEAAMLSMHEDEKGREYMQILNTLRGTTKYMAEAEVQELLKQATKE